MRSLDIEPPHITDHAFVAPTCFFRGETEPPDVCQYERTAASGTIRVCSMPRASHAERERAS